MEKKQKLEEHANVKVVGFVDDIKDEYENARLVAVPLYHGTGTSVKFVEGVMMRRPIVSTPMGSRGLDYAFVQGEDYLLANNDQEFAESIILLLNSIEKSNEISERALNKALEIFSVKQFEEIVKNTILNSI